MLPLMVTITPSDYEEWRKHRGANEKEKERSHLPDSSRVFYASVFSHINYAAEVRLLVATL